VTILDEEERRTFAAAASSLLTEEGCPSNSTISIESQLGVLGIVFRAAARVKGSAISRAQGRSPELRIFWTPAAALATEVNSARKQERVGGRGIRRRVASVTRPSIPSEPVKRPIRSKPVRFL